MSNEVAGRCNLSVVKSGFAIIFENLPLGASIGCTVFCVDLLELFISNVCLPEEKESERHVSEEVKVGLGVKNGYIEILAHSLESHVLGGFHKDVLGFFVDLGKFSKTIILLELSELFGSEFEGVLHELAVLICEFPSDEIQRLNAVGSFVNGCYLAISQELFNGVFGSVTVTTVNLNGRFTDSKPEIASNGLTDRDEQVDVALEEFSSLSATSTRSMQ